MPEQLQPHKLRRNGDRGGVSAALKIEPGEERPLV